MAKTITAQMLLQRHVSRRDRILLINPPVEETRYSWVQWGQPLDLLKLASFLRAEVGCEVALLDYLQPNEKGEVEEDWLPRYRRHHTVGEHRYPMRRFGRPFDYLQVWKEGALKSGGELPTQTWITSLCSFWHESVALVCREVRAKLPQSAIVLTGQYPRLLPEHAARGPCPLSDYAAALQVA